MSRYATCRLDCKEWLEVFSLVPRCYWRLDQREPGLLHRVGLKLHITLALRIRSVRSCRAVLEAPAAGSTVTVEARFAFLQQHMYMVRCGWGIETINQNSGCSWDSLGKLRTACVPQGNVRRRFLQIFMFCDCNWSALGWCSPAGILIARMRSNYRYFLNLSYMSILD